jgi:hypothetical protein
VDNETVVYDALVELKLISHDLKALMTSFHQRAKAIVVDDIALKRKLRPAVKCTGCPVMH